MMLLIILLAACGLTYAIQAGKAPLITNQLIKLKFFQEMFLCTFCTGCQSGFWLSLTYLLLTKPISVELVAAIPIGLASGYTAMFLSKYE